MLKPLSKYIDSFNYLFDSRFYFFQINPGFIDKTLYLQK